MARILVAGIGNIFLGDDAFGVEVVHRLARRPLPENVRVVDFGIRGLDLAYALMEGYDLTILVDAAPRGGLPGTLYAIEPEIDGAGEIEGRAFELEMHAMNPAKVLAWVRSMGGATRRMVVVGCEPAPLSDEDRADGRMGLSAPVSASLDDAVVMIEEIVRETLRRKETSPER